jgi:pimeloyl-ACP methyl ester carboxylesterase
VTGWEELSFDLTRLGITLHGRRTASRCGPPVLCVHGWLDNCASFAPLFDRMPDVNMVAVDLPGHGLSDPGPAAVYDILGYAACVLEIAHAQGWQRFQLVGHSMGGVVAAMAAGTHPEKVERLVLLDVIGMYTLDAEGFHDRVASNLDAYLRDTRPAPYPTRRQAVMARTRLGDMAMATAETLSERDLFAVDGGYSWRTDERLKYPFVLDLDEERMHAFLRHITAPTLRVVADRPTPREGPCRDMARSMTNLRTAIVPGGHHLHMENVDHVVDVVRPFLITRQSGPAPAAT